MRKPQQVAAAAVAAVVLITAGTVAIIAADEPDSASASSSLLASVPTAPSQQEALDGLEAARIYISQHPDAVVPTSPPTTTTAPPTTTPAPPTTTPPPPTTTPAPSTTTPVPPTTTIPPSTDPANFKATVGDQKIVLTWAKPTGGTPTGYIYGRNGVDNTGYGAYTSPVQPATTLTVTLDKLINGTVYQVFVEAVYATGNKRVALNAIPGLATPTATPSVTPTLTTVTPSVPVTSIGPATPFLSGLSWNSGVWANQDATQNQRFVTSVRGGRAIDNILVYTSRETQAAQNNPSSWWVSLPTNFNQAKQDLVLALTTWTGDGAFTTATQARAIGTSLCSLDTTPIVRLDWEMNLNDGAGGNGAMLNSSNYTAWVARFRAVATGLKATCPATKIDFNPNHGADQTSGCNTGATTACSRRAFQALKDVVDIFGIDRYDSFPPVTASNSGWPSHLNGFNELDESRTYALANGKKWSVPEWGVWVASNSGGGDDPKYISNYIGYFAAHSGDVAYETYFNEPADYIISDLLDHNTNSRNQYRTSILAS